MTYDDQIPPFPGERAGKHGGKRRGMKNADSDNS